MLVDTGVHPLSLLAEQAALYILMRVTYQHLDLIDQYHLVAIG